MKTVLATAGLTLVLAAAALADNADMAKVGDVMIQDSWARASIGNAPNSAAYMTLMTHGADADRLIGVTTPVAKKAELHNHIMEDGIAKMRHVEAIEVTPDEPVSLQPGGLHVMLMGLNDKLEAGEKFPLTLTFERAGEVTLDVTIKSLKDAMKPAAAHNHGS